VIPDGHADLQWVNGVLRVAGPDRTVKAESILPGSVVLGLRFQPGAVGRWLRVPTSEIVDDRVPLEKFWGADARAIAETLANGGTPDAVASCIEAELVRRAVRVRAPDQAAQAVFQVLASDAAEEQDVTRRLATALGLSARTLRRRSVEAFGYGPKTLHRILRFQRFLRLARAGGRPGGLAGLAARCGFADQAHLSREAVEMAGMTPTSVLEHLRF
jgi:AraC-like DNA-binding protein